MEGTYSQGQERSESDGLRVIEDELNELQKDFSDKVNLLRQKYFEDNKGLTVILGNDAFDIGFAVDYDAIKLPSLS